MSEVNDFGVSVTRHHTREKQGWTYPEAELGKVADAMARQVIQQVADTGWFSLQPKGKGRLELKFLTLDARLTFSVDFLTFLRQEATDDGWPDETVEAMKRALREAADQL